MVRVVKVGSTSLYDSVPRSSIFSGIAKEIADLVKKGDKVVVVSSGAIAFGKGRLDVSGGKDFTIPQKQAFASVGQIPLVSYWQKAFERHGIAIGQVLVTNEVLQEKKSEEKSHLQDTFHALFDQGIVPIVNENDAVAVDEIVQGDNDTLSAFIANICDAQELYLLGTAEAIFEDFKNRRGRVESSSLSSIDKLRSVAKDTKDPQGTGGMTTKLKAAEIFLKYQNKTNKKRLFIASASVSDSIKIAMNHTSGTTITRR